MSSFSSTTRFYSLALLIFIFMASKGFCFQLQVGGEFGWVTPAGNDSETYNRWATNLRFNIGDTLYFKYQNDSVLEVNDDDYKACDTSNPMGRYDNGSTVFELNRSGPFYFISGEEEHCMAGQRLVIQVIHASPEMRLSPQLAPSPGPSSDIGDEDAFDTAPAPLTHKHHSAASTTSFSVSSFFITTVGVVFVSIYRFV